jgi:hypothetical protein
MLEKVSIGQAVVLLKTWRQGQVPPLDFVVHSNKMNITACGTQKNDPCSDRIIEDIEGYPRVLDIIIDYSGCVVPDMNRRSGERAKNHDNKTI